MNSIVQELKNSIEQSGLIGKLTPAHILACLGTALICGTIIYIIYRVFYRGAVYSENFNTLNVLTCMTTCFIIMTISINLVLSLGMVGALSIVRFRAAVKEPLDIGFLFLAIAAGLTSGAGLYPLALIGTFMILAIYILFALVGRENKRYVLVVKYNEEAEEDIFSCLEHYHCKMKSIIAYGDTTELTVSIKYRGLDTAITKELNLIDGVNNAILMEYAGD